MVCLAEHSQWNFDTGYTICSEVNAQARPLQSTEQSNLYFF